MYGCVKSTVCTTLYVNYISIKQEIDVNVTKDKKRLWKCSRLQGVKRTWQLNAVPDSRLDPVHKEWGHMKIIIRSVDKIGIFVIN